MPHYYFRLGVVSARYSQGVYLKRTCSRVTSASSALGVLNDYALYKSTHSLTHSLTPRSAIAKVYHSED